MMIQRSRVLAGLFGLVCALTMLMSVALAQSPTPPPAASPPPTAPLPASPTDAPPATALGPEVDQLLATIGERDVYVSPAMEAQVTPSEQEDLAALAAELSSRGYPVKIAVISARPPQFETLAPFTDELHAYLGLDKGILVVATKDAVSAKSARLNREETQILTDGSSDIFKNSGYTAGIRNLVQSMVDAIQARQADNAKRALAGFFVVLLLLALGLAGLLFWRRSRWQKAIAVATAEHQRLLSTTVQVGSELDTLPANQWSQEARRLFQPVQREIFELGDQIEAVGRANLGQVVFRAGDWELVLKDALAGLVDVRNGLKRTQDLALQASPHYRTVPLPPPAHHPLLAMSSGGGLTPDELQARLAAYGGPAAACFFCAQPLQANTAQQVEAALGGRWRQLMACAHHTQEIAGGAEPLIRAVETEAGFEPWFADRNFVPYRDYDPQYNRGLTLTDLDPYLEAIDTAPVVIAADDPRWTAFRTGSVDGAGRPGMAPDSLPEGADYGPPGAPTEGDFSYAAPTIYQPMGQPVQAGGDSGDSGWPDSGTAGDDPLATPSAASEPSGAGSTNSDLPDHEAIAATERAATEGAGPAPVGAVASPEDDLEKLEEDLLEAFEEAIQLADRWSQITGTSVAVTEPAFHPDYGLTPSWAGAADAADDSDSTGARSQTAETVPEHEPSQGEWSAAPAAAEWGGRAGPDVSAAASAEPPVPDLGWSPEPEASPAAADWGLTPDDRGRPEAAATAPPEPAEGSQASGTWSTVEPPVADRWATFESPEPEEPVEAQAGPGASSWSASDRAASDDLKSGPAGAPSEWVLPEDLMVDPAPQAAARSVEPPDRPATAPTASDGLPGRAPGTEPQADQPEDDQAGDLVWELPEEGFTFDVSALEDEDDASPASGVPAAAWRPPPPRVVTDPDALGGPSQGPSPAIYDAAEGGDEVPPAGRADDARARDTGVADANRDLDRPKPEAEPVPSAQPESVAPPSPSGFMLPEVVPLEEDLTTEPGPGHREPDPEAEQSGDAGKRRLRRALGRGLRGRFNRTDE